jgi:mannitol-1-phosphate/altronate dehydrogenase
VIVERELHPQKQYSQIRSTEEGIQIDESDEQPENAVGSIHESLESDSNVIVERELHPRKQYLQIRSTEEGIQIDESDEQSSNA